MIIHIIVGIYSCLIPDGIEKVAKFQVVKNKTCVNACEICRCKDMVLWHIAQIKIKKQPLMGGCSRNFSGN